jgi:taurine dioxygenase
MSIEVEPSGQAMGAAIRGVDLSKPLSEGQAADIRAAWLAHQVVYFPDQRLTLEQLERVSQSFGPFGEDPFIAPIPGHPHVIEVKREADEQTPIFAEVWHSDWSFRPTPPAGTMLYGVEIPPVGGDTLFGDQYGAYDALSGSMKQRIETLNGVHSAARGYSKEGLYGERDKGRSMTIRPSDEAKPIWVTRRRSTKCLMRRAGRFCSSSSRIRRATNSFTGIAGRPAWSRSGTIVV